jgi:hypothetical protein
VPREELRPEVDHFVGMGQAVLGHSEAQRFGVFRTAGNGAKASSSRGSRMSALRPFAAIPLCRSGYLVADMTHNQARPTCAWRLATFH